MSPTRVGFVDHAAELGGAQNSLLDLLPRLDRSRYEPVLLCSEEATWLGRPELRDVEIAPVISPAEVLKRRRDQVPASVLRAAGDAVEVARLVVRLATTLRRKHIDIIHSNTLKAHVVGGIAGRLTGRPVLWHMRDLLEPGLALRWLLRLGRLTAPWVVAISDAVAHQFDGAGLQVTTIYNGVDLSAFTPGEPPPALVAELGLEPQDEVVAVVGRLTPWKGHRTLLDALALVAEQRPHVKLLVVGEVAFWDASYGQELRDYAAQRGVENRVVWLGFRQDVPDLMRASHVCVLPSVGEPFGRVLVEAMAVGKPVVASRSGGIPEVVVHGETGLLVEPNSPPALAAALVRVLANPALAKAMGQRGMARAHEKFDIARVAQMVQQMYDRICPPRHA